MPKPNTQESLSLPSSQGIVASQAELPSTSSSTSQPNRRGALKLAAVAGATFCIVPRHVLGGPNHIPPSEQIRLALIGGGGRGRQVLRGLMNEPEIRAVAVADPAESYSLQDFYYKDVGGREPTCDLIRKHYAESQGKSDCRGYVDFEEMLAEERDLDAVVCATPDHLHAYVSSKCLQAGKHVYCEKPLTHNIWEARYLGTLAAESGLATQMGNQGHSTDGMRETCELIWSGAIGEVREVKAWVSGHRWNPTLTGKPSEAMPTPNGLNWDRWLGPREERDFHSAYFPVSWRDFWAFGNSNIGDFGCHDLDAACWALGLRSPKTIEFHPAGPIDADIGPHGCVGYYDFPASSTGGPDGSQARGPVRITWFDGGLKPARPKYWPVNQALPSRGILFEGTEGTIFCGGAGGKPKLLPEELDGKYPRPKATIARVSNHARDWIRAIQGERRAGSHFGYGSRLTEIVLLGALSLRTGKRIEWDAEAMKATQLPEADVIIKEAYREGWTL